LLRSWMITAIFLWSAWLKDKEVMSTVMEHVLNYYGGAAKPQGPRASVQTMVESTSIRLSLTTLALRAFISQHTVPYSPQQSGQYERLNRTLLEKTCSMLANQCP
jgi:hypothetical protein